RRDLRKESPQAAAPGERAPSASGGGHRAAGAPRPAPRLSPPDHGGEPPLRSAHPGRFRAGALGPRHLYWRPVTPRRTLIQSFPTTVGLLVLIGAAFLLEEAAGGSQRVPVLIGLGANYPPLVIQEGEWWRLLTSTLLHIGLLHLLVNSWALWQLGRLSEITFGSALTLFLFVFTGLTGSGLTLIQEKV